MRRIRSKKSATPLYQELEIEEMEKEFEDGNIIEIIGVGEENLYFTLKGRIECYCKCYPQFYFDETKQLVVI